MCPQYLWYIHIVWIGQNTEEEIDDEWMIDREKGRKRQIKDRESEISRERKETGKMILSEIEAAQR